MSNLLGVYIYKMSRVFWIFSTSHQVARVNQGIVRSKMLNIEIRKQAITNDLIIDCGYDRFGPNERTGDVIKNKREIRHSLQTGKC